MTKTTKKTTIESLNELIQEYADNFDCNVQVELVDEIDIAMKAGGDVWDNTMPFGYNTYTDGEVEYPDLDVCKDDLYDAFGKQISFLSTFDIKVTGGTYAVHAHMCLDIGYHLNFYVDRVVVTPQADLEAVEDVIRTISLDDFD